ncbi:TlpA family protein disulfide reductase [Parachitinimonas caeni]|uniref:TlpA disulfide reductase family protein n=1 Tax=Parachitinimonas caeni TaxID=3031301 RepID=A0ABT7DXS4_9NEIS|nr:TlpA disulfide reductase family protein [Parachitinimonas caeni]MDK2124858.1 TlpA disulfide reductase family protein [Parachitinimonas caeni]
MRKALLLALAVVSLTTQAIEPGQPAPAVSLPDGQGKTMNLASLRGKVVYLDFWASWCGPCRKSFPWMNELGRQHGKDGLIVVAINLDEQRADANQFLIRQPASFQVLYDPGSSTAKAFGLKGMPSSYLIDQQGVIRYSHIGFRDDSPAEITPKILELLKQK